MSDAPVLLVHGFASSFRHGWKETGMADLLADGGRDVIPVDLLGHGDAPKPHDPAAYADLESLVGRYLPASGPVDAVGFSLGARVVLWLAAQDPSRFDRIVVAGVGSNLFVEHSTEAIAAAVESGAAGEDKLGSLFASLAHQSGNDRAALAACMRREAPPLTRDDLAKIDVPVLVVLGDQDFVAPADPLVEALPNATFKSLRNCDHFSTPKEFGFIDATLGFLGVELD